MRNRVLVVDDESIVCTSIEKFLVKHGYEVSLAASCAEAMRRVGASRPDAVIVDHHLPDGTALDLIPRLKTADPSVAIIVLTGHASIDLAVTAIKKGADHFLTKPTELPTLLILLERLLAERRGCQIEAALRTQQERTSLDPFIGSSAATARLRADVEKIVRTDRPLLIEGETGSGKGVLAAWVHRNSPRASEAFVDLNCAGLGREFLESELFGHSKGAFTGAVQSKQGLLEIADHGTIFLDEIGDVDLDVQPKLLKVLEEKKFRRLGEVRDHCVSLRLIAATHHPLDALVQQRRFRSDLYYRISTIPIALPPLRERREDIPLLAMRLLDDAARELGRGSVGLDAAAVEALAAYSWPGNIRELRNVLERSLILSEGNTISRGNLRFELRGTMLEQSIADLTLEQVEKIQIERVLEAENGSVIRAAARLGIGRNTLYYKLQKHGIPVPKDSKAMSKLSSS